MSEAPTPLQLVELARHYLAEHLRTVAYPQPEDRADLAAIVSRAFMYGAAIVAEAAGIDGAPLIAEAFKIMSNRAHGKRTQIILPGHQGWR